MATYVDRVQLLFLFLSVSEAIVSQLYTVNFEFDSKAPMYTPSDTLPAASLPICASVCGNRCKCFSYNSQTKMCRLHSSCDTTNWRSEILNGGPTQPPRCNQKVCGLVRCFQDHVSIIFNWYHFFLTSNLNKLHVFVCHIFDNAYSYTFNYTIFALVYIIIYWIYSTK